MGVIAAVGHPHRCPGCSATWTHRTWACESAEERQCPECDEKAQKKG